MDATLDRTTWLSMLKTVESAMPRSTGNNPVLACVKITVDERGCSLFATDSELSIRSSTLTNDAKLGSLLIPADRFKAILSTSPDGPVRVRESDAILVKPIKGSFSLPIYKVDDYPDAALTPPAKTTVSVAADSLCKILRRGAIAAGGVEGSRFVTSSTCLELADNRLHASGTDTKLLSTSSVSVHQDTKEKLVALIPPLTVRAITSALSGSTDQVRIGFSSHMLTVETESLFLSTTLIYGRFPPWRDIVNKTRNKTDITAIADPGLFHAAMRQVTSIVDKESLRVWIDWASETKIRITKSARGEGDTDFALASYEGSPTTKAFDSQILGKLLAERASEKRGELMEIRLAKDDFPVIFNFDDEWQGLIMPLESEEAK